MNDLWDRDLDNQVERTKSRPLASGALSVRQGLGDAFLVHGVACCMVCALFWCMVHVLSWCMLCPVPQLPQCHGQVHIIFDFDHLWQVSGH